TTVIRGDVAAEVAKLKDRYEREIQVHGSAALVQTLHRLGLIDEYRLFIEPVVLGTGKRLFEPGSTPNALQLVEARPMDKGAVLAIYRPAGPPSYGEFQMEDGLGLPDAGAPGRARRPPLAAFAADPVTVGVEVVDVDSNDGHRSGDVRRAVPTPTGTVDVACDRNTRAGVVRIASAPCCRRRRDDR